MCSRWIFGFLFCFAIPSFSQEVQPNPIVIEWQFNDVAANQSIDETLLGSQNQRTHAIQEINPLFNPKPAAFSSTIDFATARGCPIAIDGLASGLNGCNGAGDYAINARSWSGTKDDREHYFSFEVDVQQLDDYCVDFSSAYLTVQFTAKRSNTGPKSMSVAYQFDGNGWRNLPDLTDRTVYQSWGQNANPIAPHEYFSSAQVDLSSFTPSTFPETMAFRVFAYDADNKSRGAFRVDDFSISVHGIQRIDQPKTAVQFDVVEQCSPYVLPSLPNGNQYWTEASGTGQQLFPGDEVEQSQTIYVYAPADPNTRCQPSETKFQFKRIKEKQPEFQLETSYCVGDASVALPSTSSNGVTGQWSHDSIRVETVGDFTYQFTPENACHASYELEVTVKPCDCVQTFTLEKQACVGETIRLPDGEEVTATIGESTYESYITNDLQCDEQYDIHVIGSGVRFPSALSPNGDGRNDLFQPLYNDQCRVTDYQLSIFNRWGECVFTTDDQTATWQPTSGTNQQSLYIWSVAYSVNDQVVKESGVVRILR